MSRIPEEGGRSSRAGAGGKPSGSSPLENVLREARRLLAARSFAEVISRLEVHRPAEWAPLDETGGRLLRLLGQAFLGEQRWRDGCDCLEQLRAAHQQKPILSRNDYAATLSDLSRCYRELSAPQMAQECLDEARRTLQSGD